MRIHMFIIEVNRIDIIFGHTNIIYLVYYLRNESKVCQLNNLTHTHTQTHKIPEISRDTNK